MSLDELPPLRIPLNVALRLLETEEMTVVTTAPTKQLSITEYSNRFYILREDHGFYVRMDTVEEATQKYEVQE